MKTPDEIKKGMLCCSLESCRSDKCPYKDHTPKYEGDRAMCRIMLWNDATALIQQLEAELRDAKANHQHTIDIAERQKGQIDKLKKVIVRLNAERDAAVRELADHCACLVCQHADTEPDKAPCNECTNCNVGVVELKWPWGGL